MSKPRGLTRTKLRGKSADVADELALLPLPGETVMDTLQRRIEEMRAAEAAEPWLVAAVEAALFPVVEMAA